MPDFKIDKTAYQVHIEAELGGAASFAHYDTVTNRFFVDA